MYITWWILHWLEIWKPPKQVLVGTVFQLHIVTGITNAVWYFTWVVHVLCIGGRIMKAEWKHHHHFMGGRTLKYSSFRFLYLLFHFSPFFCLSVFFFTFSFPLKSCKVSSSNGSLLRIHQLCFRYTHVLELWPWFRLNVRTDCKTTQILREIVVTSNSVKIWGLVLVNCTHG